MDIEKFFKKPLNIFLMAIISTALWGSAIPAIKIGYELFEIDGGDAATKFLFAGVRFTLAGLFVIIVSSIINKGLVYPTRNNIKCVIYLGLVQTALEYVFFYVSLTYLSGVKGAIINSIGNFFAVILAHFCFKDDKLNLRKILGCALGFAGVVICNCSGGESIDFSFSIMGEGFMLAAAMCFATGSVITKIFSKDIKPTTLTGYQLLLGGIILTVMGVILGGQLKVITAKGIWLLIYLAVLSSAAFAVWSLLLKYNSVARISIYCFLNPLFGIFFAGIFLGEEIFNAETFISLFLVCAGIYIVNMTGREKAIE